MNPFRSVGARLSLALVGVVALALGLVYEIVVPSLRQRLVDAKLGQLNDALPRIKAEVAETRFDWADKLETWSSRASARVVVYTIVTPVTGKRHAGLLLSLIHK
jgi:hypothetical protein